MFKFLRRLFKSTEDLEDKTISQLPRTKTKTPMPKVRKRYTDYETNGVTYPEFEPPTATTDKSVSCKAGEFKWNPPETKIDLGDYNNDE